MYGVPPISYEIERTTWEYTKMVSSESFEWLRTHSGKSNVSYMVLAF